MDISVAFLLTTTLSACCIWLSIEVHILLTLAAIEYSQRVDHNKPPRLINHNTRPLASLLHMAKDSLLILRLCTIRALVGVVSRRALVDRALAILKALVLMVHLLQAGSRQAKAFLDQEDHHQDHSHHSRQDHHNNNLVGSIQGSRRHQLHHRRMQE